MKIKELLQKKTFILLSIALVSFLMHLHIFNRDLVGVHVWRQTQTQINIENFAYNDFNILNTRSYNLNNNELLLRYEFPLMQWSFACFYKLFGDHIIISRLLSFIIGLFSIIGIYNLLNSLFSNKTLNALGSWAFAFSPIFYYYIVNPLPDNLALCTGIWSLYYFFRFIDMGRNRDMILSFLFLLLATLTKLPFIIYGLTWFVYMIVNLKKDSRSVIKITLLGLLFITPAIAWYAWVIPHWEGNGIVKGMLNTSAGMKDLLYIMQSNLISTLPELLVNYGSLLFFIVGLVLTFKYKLYKKEKGKYLATLGIGLILYFLFEMNMIGTVHDYYLFPFLPLLFILVAYSANRFINSEKKWLKGFSYFLLIILPLTAFLRINQRWNTVEPGFNRDLWAYKKELRSCVPDSAKCIVGNDNSAHIWPYYLHKKCWNFYDNYFTEQDFNKFIANGARYLYSDSREVENYPFVKAKIKGLVLQRGSIKVFELSR